MMPTVLWLTVLILVSGFAQGSDDQSLDIFRQSNIAEPKIQFLGVGGWLLHWRGEGFLTAPSFSNPALFGRKGLVPLWVEANKAQIDKYMPPANDVTMLLVGHGHYDHLLDVPWIMRKHTPNAKIYGNDTVVYILRSMRDSSKVEDEHWTWVDPKRVVSVQRQTAQVQLDGASWKPTLPGVWVTSTGGKIRAMPIESMHAGHIFGINMVPGDYDTDLTEVPTSLFGWKPGKSLAWLIDLLDDTGTKTVYRIHYQDSASSAPYGFPPMLPDGKAIDVEILSVGSWQQVSNYPDELLKLTRPRLVLLGHWESFFGNDPNHPEPLRGQHQSEMMTTVKRVVPNAAVFMPAPFTEITLPPAQ